MRKIREKEKKKEPASLILGTTFTSLWLLRSRPDQVHDECMRGDPPNAQFSTITRDFCVIFELLVLEFMRSRTSSLKLG